MGFFKTLFGGHEETAEEKAESKQQYNFEVLTYDAVQAMQVGKVDYAIACLERALTIRDNDEETRYRLAQAYVQKDRLEEAAEQFESLCLLAPDNAAYPLALADLCFQQEQYDEMEQACRRALAIDDSLAMPHYLLAKRAFARSEWAEAADECTAALNQKDDYAEARLLRAQSLKNANLLDEAMTDVERMVADEQGTDEVLLLKAQILAAQNRNDEAAEAYRASIELNPFVPAAYIELSALLRNAGKNDEAQRVMDDAVEQLGVSPDDAKVLQMGDGTSVEEYMRNAYNALNPYQLSVKL